jgi:hypothetical protein
MARARRAAKPSPPLTEATFAAPVATAGVEDDGRAGGAEGEAGRVDGTATTLLVLVLVLVLVLETLMVEVRLGVEATELTGGAG